MCVIIYKPEGIELPDKELLQLAHFHNPDGCGFCTPRKSFKGLSFDSFMRNVKDTDADEPLLIHFRFATHGSVRRANCHPFYDKATGTYFMHNGVLSNIRTTGDRTDSECAFERYIKPVLRYGLDSWMFGRAVYEIIGGSRFAFMQGGEVRLFGDFTLFEGCAFSNLRFLCYRRYPF